MAPWRAFYALEQSRLQKKKAKIAAQIACVNGPLIRKPQRQTGNGNVAKQNGSARALWIFVHFFAVTASKQQREMIKFCVVYRTWTTTANFWYYHMEKDDVIAYLASLRFKSYWRGAEQI